jgi:outer membrane protein assembly factor BamB
MNATGALSEFSAPITMTPTNIWYVDSASGNNTTGLGSLALPYLKIQKGIDKSINGDTVYVKPGTYIESILINKSILVKSTEGVAKTKLIQESGIGYSIKIYNPTFSDPYTTTRINGFYMKGNGNSNNSIGLRVEQKAYATLDNVFMDGYDLDLSTYYGYYTVNNSIFYGSRIFAYGDAGDVDKSNVVQNSTIINTTWSVYEASTNSTNKYYNLIITNEKSKPFQSPNPFNGPRPFLYNVILDKSFATYNPQDGSTKFIVDDAESMRFKNFALKDFRLENTSPAIGFGNSTLSNPFDYDGQPRPNPAGSNPDAGAYENIYDHPAPFIDTDSSRNGFVLLKMTQTPAGTVNKFNIYKGLTTAPTTKYKDTTLVTKYTDSLNSVFNKVIYYRMTSVGASNLESGYSNEVRTISFTPPSLNFPTDLSVKADTNINFQWEKIDNATNYKIQYSTDSNFVNSVVEIAKTDTSHLKTSLVDNTSYFWRLQTLDSVHYSKWSNFKRFQTFVRKPILNSISTVNRVITINWSVNSLRNIKAFKIYRGTGANPTTKIDSISSANLTYNDSVTNGVKYYYRVTSVNTDNIESLYSNELFANSFGVTILDSPSNNKVKEILKPAFKWQSVEFATKYNIQVSTNPLFTTTPILDTVSSITSLVYTKGLSDNTTYYWRVRVGDNNGYGNWSDKNSFQTYVLAPNLLSVAPSNKIDTLNWSVLSSNNIKYFKIYRDTIANPQVVLDSITGSLRSYIDTTKLQLNKKYYYTLITGNNENIESVYSNELSATPFNTLPKTITLTNKTFNNVGEFNFVRSNYSAVGSNDPDGKIADYKWFVNDSLVNATDSILIYYFNQGSNKVKLIITDNDGGKDSSSALVNLSSFVKTFEGGFLGGIAALSPNIIYTADTTYNPINGASISKLDRSGNTVYPLVVSSKIFTTPSVSSDSSVFITSGSSLNGFNKSGAPLWSTIPLGGLSYVTPTIDSLFNRIYVGVSNKNFFAIDYKTGKVVWNLIGDAPVNASAIITGDRKLVFTSQAGTLYGFDIRTNVAQTAAKWSTNFGEVVTKSPAVDANNNLIIGTESGKVLKVKLNDDGTVARTWSVSVNASIQSSPVIDGDGFIYVGNTAGDFYKLNPDNGAVIWKYATGAAIKSTPTISEFGNIYISNTNGVVTALTTGKILKWTYQADGPISANMLYISNMLYIGTEKGKFFAIYDNPVTNTVNTGLSMNLDKNRLRTYSYGSLASSSPLNLDEKYGYYYDAFKKGAFNFTVIDNVVAKEPVWGTFQGNYRRTGSKTFECPEVPVVKIPNCIESDEVIKITTANLSNKYWVVNDVVLDKVTDTSLYVKSTDKYKLMAFNKNGCNVYSNDPVLIMNSSIAKPKITTNSGITKFCDGDSIILSSNITATKYQWNYLTSPVADATAKNLSTSLQGAYSVTAINEYGCKATSDISLILTTPKPSVAAIDGVNALCIGATSKLTNATVGGVWSSGAESIVKVDASGNVSSVAAGTGAINYTITANGCSNTSKINIKVNETPIAPKADNVALCIGGTSTALIANASGGHSLLWYGSSATGGQSSGTAPIPSTNAQGSTDYYVSQSNNSTTCESPRTKVTVSVAPAPATPTITRDANGNLTSSATSGNQWYKNGAEIIGATSTLYKPTEVANYSVKIQGVCVSPMSTTYYFLVTDVINLSATEFIKLAPNPFQTKLNFDFAIKGYQKLNMDVFELASGRKVSSRVGLTPGSPVYLPELVGGTYIVRITSADGKLSYQFKMVKM